MTTSEEYEEKRRALATIQQRIAVLEEQRVNAAKQVGSDSTAIVPNQPNQPAQRPQYSPWSIVEQTRFMSESDREVMDTIVDEFMQYENWDVILENPDINYIIFVPFAPNPYFENRFSEEGVLSSGIFVLSPVPFGELVTFGKAQVPSTIMTVAQLGAMEVVEKIRGVGNIPFCLAPGTIVYGNAQACEVENFMIGEQVLTPEGMSQVANKSVSRYVGYMLRITPYYTNIPTTLSLGHKVAVLRLGNWHGVEPPPGGYSAAWARGSRKGHFKAWLRLPRKILGLIEWKEASYLRPNFRGRRQRVPGCDYLIIPRDLEMKDIDVIDFGKYRQRPPTTWKKRRLGDVALTGELMRLIGYYIAEGSVSARGGEVRWTFNKTETDYASDVVQIVRAALHLPARIGYGKGTCEAWVCNRDLAAFLLSECGASSLTKHVPNWSLHLSFAKQAQLLKGLFRGDACKTDHGHRLSTASRTLAYQVKFLMDRLGVLSSLLLTKRKTHTVLFYGIETKVHDWWSVYITGPSLSRLETLLNEFHPYLERHHPTSEVGHVTNDALLVPIKKIEKFWYDGPVHDLTVPLGESFLTTNMLCHNCIPLADEYHVQEIRRGRLDPVMRVSNLEVELADRLIDKGHLSERLMHFLITAQRALYALQERELDVWTKAVLLTEGLVKDRLIGKGASRVRVSGKVVLAVLVTLIVGATLVFYAMTAGLIK
jgi:intein/homing endonuclease